MLDAKRRGAIFSASREPLRTEKRLWIIHCSMLLFETMRKLLRDLMSYFNMEDTVYSLVGLLMGETSVERLTDATEGGTSVDPEPFPSTSALERDELVAEFLASCTFSTSYRDAEVADGGEARDGRTASDAVSIAIECSLKEALRVSKATHCTETLSEDRWKVSAVGEIAGSKGESDDAEKDGASACAEFERGDTSELGKEEKEASEPVIGTITELVREQKMVSKQEGEEGEPAKDSNITSRPEEEKMAIEPFVEDVDTTSQPERVDSVGGEETASEPEKENDITTVPEKKEETPSQSVEADGTASQPEEDDGTASQPEEEKTEPVEDDGTTSQPEEEKMASEPEKEDDITDTAEEEKMASATVEDEKIAFDPVKDNDTTSDTVEEETIVPEPVEDSDTTFEPVEEEKMASEPVEEEKMASEPVEDNNTTFEPVEEEKMASEPVEDNNTTFEPVEEEKMASEPVEEEKMASEPVENDTTFEPVEEEKMASEPVEDNNTTFEPVEEEKMASEPAEDNDTTFEPVEEEKIASEEKKEAEQISEQIKEEKGPVKDNKTASEVTGEGEMTPTPVKEDDSVPVEKEKIPTQPVKDTATFKQAGQEDSTTSEPVKKKAIASKQAAKKSSQSTGDQQNTVVPQTSTNQDNDKPCPLPSSRAPGAVAASKKALGKAMKAPSTLPTAAKKRRRRKSAKKRKDRSLSPIPTQCPRPGDDDCDDDKEPCALYKLCPQLALGAKCKMYQPPPPQPHCVRGKATFDPPLSSEDFDRRVNRKKVCLEFVEIRRNQICGYVRVLNNCRDKEVMVRYTIERTDCTMLSICQAEWVETVGDGSMDRYSFTIQGLHTLGKVSFLIHYNGIYVDNNRGKKYTVAYEAV